MPTDAPPLQTLDLIYARALFELAQQDDQLDQTAEEINELSAWVAQDQSLNNLLTNRLIPVPARAQSIERLFKGRLSDRIYRFLQVLNRKGRLDLLSDVGRAFRTIVDEHRGLLEVDAFVPRELQSQQTSRIAETLSKALNRQVSLRQRVEPHLIGGLKLRIGDRLIDGSVAAQLRMLQDRLVTASRDRARSSLESLVQS